MKTKNESNLILKVIEYAINKETFTLEEFEADFKEYEEYMFYIKNTLFNYNFRESNPNQIITISYPEYIDPKSPSINRLKSKYRLLPSAYFSYIDHLEVIEARNAAKEAKRLSWIAILISIGIGLIQIIIETLK
jgi:hypothetical protein